MPPVAGARYHLPFDRRIPCSPSSVEAGITRLSTLAVARREVVRTPYGRAGLQALVLRADCRGADVVFLRAHGHGQRFRRTRLVNYRANLCGAQ